MSMSKYATKPDYWQARAERAEAEIERLRALVMRALPMADALDATKTAVVWTTDLQVGAAQLARDIRAAAQKE